MDKGKGVGWEEDKQIGHHQPVVVGTPPMSVLNASKLFSTTSYLKLNIPHDRAQWGQLNFKGVLGLQILERVWVINMVLERRKTYWPPQFSILSNFFCPSIKVIAEPYKIHSPETH